LADEFSSDRENQSLHAKKINAILNSPIYINTPKSLFVSDKVNDATNDDANDAISDLDEELIQFKPHQRRSMTTLCRTKKERNPLQRR